MTIPTRTVLRRVRFDSALSTDYLPIYGYVWIWFSRHWCMWWD